MRQRESGIGTVALVQLLGGSVVKTLLHSDPMIERALAAHCHLVLKGTGGFALAQRVRDDPARPSTAHPVVSTIQGIHQPCRTRPLASRTAPAVLILPAVESSTGHNRPYPLELALPLPLYSAVEHKSCHFAALLVRVRAQR